MNEVPAPLREHTQFLKYFETWSRNRASIVFVPMAEILRDQGLLDEALELCKIGLEHNHDSISGRLIQASVYWALNRKTEAERVAAQVLARMPGHPEALKYAPKLRQEALKQKKSVQGKDMWHTPTMAEILVGQGEYQEAIRILQELSVQDPKDRELRMRIQELEEMITGEEKTVV